ncbi:HAD family hydrolase [Kitasatospora sp. NPDC004745]|uniref:HAD family hydrolase n=1 Tax=Kitasatospora sp. NPDC004745 TaxID=3364019 RepID=UPI003696561E
MGRLVLMDLDDTLINRRDAVTAWAADFSADRRLPPRATQMLAEALQDRARPETFEGLRVELGLTEPPEELWATYRAGMAAKVVCDSATLARLDLLRAAGWSVGVLTNGPTDIQQAKLATAGILDHVDAVCISEEAGARKPDPAVFRTAASRCGFVLPAEAWMVGDNPVTDIAGASAAGLRTVWISAGTAWTVPGLTPDHIATTVGDAADFLLRLPEGAR